MKFKRQSSEEVSVNLTPLIDVVFLLLIFFMVSTTFTKQAHLKIDLPVATNDEVTESLRQVDITITANGHYSVNDQPLINSQSDTLKRAIDKASRSNNDLPVIITADAKTPHQFVVTAMDVAGQLGFVHLSITTRTAAKDG